MWVGVGLFVQVIVFVLMVVSASKLSWIVGRKVREVESSGSVKFVGALYQTGDRPY